MAFEEVITFNRRTIVAAADLSAKQYYAITNNNIATAAKNIDGVLQDNPVSGKAGCIAFAGVSKVAITANQAVNANGLLEVDAAGTFKPLAAGIPVAKAMENLPATNAICLIAAELMPSNAAFA